MNITPHIQNIPLATVVNPATDSLRRDNNVREVIAQPAAASQSAAEKGVASEKDRGKTSAQDNEQIDFANLRKQAEENSTSISGSTQEKQEQSSNPEQQNAKSEKSTEGQTISANEGIKEKRELVVEQQKIESLKSRDREVRAHEQAHSSVGGTSTGAPSFTYQVGPDGKKYAVGGEVSVDLSTVSGDPQATITKMQKVYSAALAPADPSSQDHRVAASASRAILQAQTEILSSLNAAESENKAEQARVATSAKFVNDLEHEGEHIAVENGETLSNEPSGQLSGHLSSQESSNEFDTLIANTLESQETIAPSRSEEIAQRSLRIEAFYSTINNAYEKQPNFQFKLIA